MANIIAVLIIAVIMMFTGCAKTETEMPDESAETETAELGQTVWDMSGKGELGTASFDIDGDGITEDIFMDYGPTSGVYSILLTAKVDSVIKYQNVVALESGGVELTKQNGVPKLGYDRVYFDQDGHQRKYGKKYYDITVNDNGIELLKDGETMPYMYNHSTLKNNE